MGTISGGKIAEGLGIAAPILNAGAPVNGTDEQQTLTFGGTPTGGTFRLAFKGKVTAAIAWTATDATLVSNIQTALRALSTIGATGCSVANTSLVSGVGVATVTFAGNLAKLAVDQITVHTNSLTGTSPTLVAATSVAGVTASGRGAAVGASLVDTTNAVEYINTGTQLEPTWTVKGTQT